MNIELKNKRLLINWKWMKFTWGIWRDVPNNTALGIDLGPLEIKWVYPEYRP